MVTHELIERIEGEAFIDFRTDRDGRVEEANVRFPHFRGMEAILEGRGVLDALVLTPRVCGICGHSHLISAVEMIESLYRNGGEACEVSPKARSLRRITLQTELLQSHLKWLYLTMLPESAKLLGKESRFSLKALYAASQVNTIAALFSGQWPHNSYALPGGVTCDPTYVEVMQALKILSEIEKFVVSEVIGCPLDVFLSLRSRDEVVGLEGDAGKLFRDLERLGLCEAGKSHGRFLVLGEGRQITSEGGERADATEVGEEAAYAPHGKSHARNALYGGEFFETGPLARALVRADGVIAVLARESGNGALSRSAARIVETASLVCEIRSLLEGLDLSEPSFIPPSPIDHVCGEGTGIVEAPRGTLIHRATVEKGKIRRYSIITPTQWNLGNGTPERPGIAQKAMLGLDSTAKASLIFRTFDVCSVCTTH